jgi:hypothetical protein
MKFGELKSIGHNIADSLASGICLMIGHYDVQVFSEAANSSEGHITVDFLTGTSSGAKPSKKLARAIREFGRVFPEFCRKSGAERNVFKELTARYAVDKVYGGHFTVTVEDQNGRRSVDQYVGAPGRRIGGYRPNAIRSALAESATPTPVRRSLVGRFFRLIARVKDAALRRH